MHTTPTQRAVNFKRSEDAAPPLNICFACLRARKRISAFASPLSGFQGWAKRLRVYEVVNL